MLESILSNIVTGIATAILTSKPFLIYAAYAVGMGFALWSLWVTLNVAYNRKQRLAYKLLLVTFAVPGFLVDVLFQFTVGTALFWEWPQESTFSKRLTRIISGRTADKNGTANYGWRIPVAVWIATNLVEPWQRGHIGLEKYGRPAARDAIGSLMKRLP